MSEDSFTEDELPTIRKFLAWVKPWLSNDSYRVGEGVTGFSDEGVEVTEFESVSDYDSTTFETTVEIIPWLALTDPPAYDRRVKEEAAEKKRREAVQHREYERERRTRQDAEDRAEFERLKAKFGAQPRGESEEG